MCATLDRLKLRSPAKKLRDLGGFWVDMKMCPFCDILEQDDLPIVFENELCFFVQQVRVEQTLEGSGVIVPKEHRTSPFELTIGEWNATYELLQRARSHIETHYEPDGYNVGWNVGRVGGQEVAHVHLHLIPRFRDEPLAGKGIRYWLKSPENGRSRP